MLRLAAGLAALPIALTFALFSGFKTEEDRNRARL